LEAMDIVVTLRRARKVPSGSSPVRGKPGCAAEAFRSTGPKRTPIAARMALGYIQ